MTGAASSKTRLMVAAAALGLACGASDTVVFVVVTGTSPRPIRQLEVAATVAGTTRTLRVPSEPQGIIFLDTSFTLQLPRSLTGRLALTVTALDSDGAAIESGAASIDQLQVGTTNHVTVLLGEGTADAGADAAPDVPPPADAPPPDTAADAGPDVAPDLAPDVAIDRPLDGPADLAAEGGGDAARDAGAE